jgi:undecaprenol kinase
MVGGKAMKGHSQLSRFRYALEGLRSAWAKEASFRTEVVIASVVAFGLILLKAGLQPWLMWLMGTTLVLSVELVNTALEHVCDALHPEQHPLIKIAKDCASAAVFVVCTGVGVMFGIVLWRLW